MNQNIWNIGVLKIVHDPQKQVRVKYLQVKKGRTNFSSTRICTTNNHHMRTDGNHVR